MATKKTETPTETVTNQSGQTTSTNTTTSGDEVTGGGGETNDPAPASPSKVLVFAATTAQDNMVTLNWLAPSAGGTPSGYRVYRGTSSGVSTAAGEIATLGAVTTYQDSTAMNGTKYYYKIVAFNTAGTAAASNEVYATPWNPLAAASDTMVFVDGNNAGAEDGSFQSPYNTLAEAHSALNAAGGEIIIKDSTLTYASYLNVTKAAHIRSLTGHYQFSDAILTAGGANTYAMRLDGVTGVNIIGLEFQNFGNTVIFSNDSHTVNIRNNFINGTLNHGIYTDASLGSELHDWSIVGNKITNLTGSNDSAIIASYLEDCVISENILSNTTYAGIQMSYLINCLVNANTVNTTDAYGLKAGTNLNGVTITNNTVTGANQNSTSDHGCMSIYAPQSGTVTISGNTFDNCYNGVAVSDGKDVTGLDIHVNNNIIRNNTNRGFYHGGSGVIDATGNYWGDASGPTHASNPTGTGQVVDNNVTFSSFLTSE